MIENVENNEMIENNETTAVAVVNDETRSSNGVKEAVKLGAAYGAAVGGGLIVGLGVGDMIVRGLNWGLHKIADKFEKKKPDKEQASEVTPPDKEVK